MQATIHSATEMQDLGTRIAAGLQAGVIIFLRGALGTGKTTLVGGILRGLGHAGAVKSPTFTLVEPYELAGLSIFHFDLYRLNDPEELEFLGVRDYLQGQGICLVEWPEQGEGVLPTPDIDVTIERINDARTVQLQAKTQRGVAGLRGVTGVPE